MKLSIDFGDTIVRRVNGVQTPFDGAIMAISTFVQMEIPVYIISKVDEQQKIGVLSWLKESDFHKITGVDEANVFFCEKRSQKAYIASNLGITHHVDNRPDVFTNMDPHVRKYLFNPKPEEVVEFFNLLYNTVLMKDWEMVYNAVRFEWDGRIVKW
jgi:hypothetical protein